MNGLSSRLGRMGYALYTLCINRSNLTVDGDLRIEKKRKYVGSDVWHDDSSLSTIRDVEIS